MTQTKFQSEIRILIEQCKGREEIILKDLGFNVDKWGNVKCQCPIHNGDNPNGFSWSAKMNCWKCWTHHCHEDHGCSIFGLVRAVKECSAIEAKKYIEEILNIQGGSITSSDIHRKDYIRQQLSEQKEEIERTFNKDLLNKAEKTFDYLINRGFDKNNLERYGAFSVNNPSKPLHRRIVFPIYNKDSCIIGFTGRIIDDETKPKWIHYPNIRSGNYLFGLEQNKINIKKTHTALLMEGPLDVIRCSQAGLNIGVASFGTNLSIRQIKQLISLGVHNLILCYDHDNAGTIGMQNIIKQSKLYFRVYDFSHILTKDPGKADISEIQSKLKVEIEKICSNQ